MERHAEFLPAHMVPEMSHGLGNGEGPHTFDLLTALETWVEQAEAPDSLEATHLTGTGAADRTRPLCSYPAVAHYRGSGDLNQAASFVCRE